MRSDMPPDCSAEFRKRRNRLAIIAFPLAAAMMTAFEAITDPGFHAYGLSRVQTLWVGIGGTAILLGLNLLDWRCPNCNAYLNDGITISFCKRCGALFFPPPPDKTDDLVFSPEAGAEARRAQAEAALKNEIKQHRGHYIVKFVKALIVIGLGALMAFVLDPGPTPDITRISRLIGWGVMALGAFWMVWAAHSFSTTAQYLTEKYRDLLGLEK
ncbi:MAG TPA: hypothetical protein VFR31_18230 [Thermoanaerobaculia bacterium]|nr:hypothetical protein [Thermoanaerobaculia bacterium]